MKICYVTPYSPREITGVSTFLGTLIYNLKLHGIESITITRVAKPAAETSVQMIEINCNLLPQMKDAYLAIRTSIEIFKLRKDITLIHLQTPLPQSALAALTGKFLGIPVVTTIHGRYPPLSSRIKKKIYQVMEKITVQYSDAVIFVSNDVRQDYSFDKGRVILNGIDVKKLSFNQEVRTQKRIELGIKENETVFIYIGRWVAHKGIYNLLESFGDLIVEGKKAKLIFIGSGESEKLTNEIKKGNLTENVLPIGKVNNVRDYFCAADLFVLYTSCLEGLPLALLEAMACRVVPIATNVSGIPEVIVEGENGFLIEEGKLEDLKHKMKWSVDNREHINKIKYNSERSIKEKYNIERMTSEYLEVYREITKTKS
jgi:glycosyltransferase involved in cell wall biosynthesis